MGGQKVVLVLSADEGDSKILAGLASQPGLVVEFARSAREAFDLAAEWGPPDAVLFSTRLPGGVGEYVKRVRAESPDVLLVACPSEGDEEFHWDGPTLPRPFGLGAMAAVLWPGDAAHDPGRGRP